jgi:hypothetical protein
VIDPDEEVRTAVADVFVRFEAKGSAYAVVEALQSAASPPAPMAEFGRARFAGAV